jgi:hypothetical protein
MGASLVELCPTRAPEPRLTGIQTVGTPVHRPSQDATFGALARSQVSASEVRGPSGPYTHRFREYQL